MKRVAVVTGAAKGVGAAIAKRLVTADLAVVIHYHTSEADAKKTLAQLRRVNPDCAMLPANLRETKQAEQLINLVMERYGRIDLLINNVGNFIYKPLARTSIEDWNDVIETNLTATFSLCQAVLPQMRQQKYGRIVNVGQVDAARMVIRPKTTPYAIAKTGVVMLTKQLAFDNAKFGIRVNAISPGIVETSVVKLKTPTGTLVPVEDIANAVAYLVADESTQVNGANLEVANGFTFE
ncbi:MAG: bifunctional dihydropteridine reductase/dihydrofolate reductase TmpR [Candidatus Kerfeldbacteria bacterium CG15_BIG_FIL_POST_REV_8_21_14_020_45_12]|uniref:Bifunctional dihydropteridine reductase/dihydrofolate reductase TmpR n=1 Tax=Candidatus Kerfeldbacteria bacterium CG15_BIG_FIL_POST_REV_8_21_14_020_45_12 TaxID=2014247 RepID=A0A2M7H2S6_9BACT|nr:MAG: bifunctional dihydropteridine reductase/dihydrofolate reductase TmpR [Candidatus Kerfeldbacteria bacterium CG15_BIG_FIL_POST_REV_8_21_14_020_45_12]PJA93276.1 MAG: bifunctional dihydropteridine reductase/dihydrofolate reductase TmpR [Candidatus Kerfeldbacteria bacterium CG_4_9_14_3_um_filter_45_8]